MLEHNYVMMEERGNEVITAYDHNSEEITQKLYSISQGGSNEGTTVTTKYALAYIIL